MRYMLLLHHPEELRHPPGSPAFFQGLEAFEAFHAELARRGVAWVGDPLQPTQTSTSVRVRDGDTLVTDGPFAEVKEQLGGYYIVDVAGLEEAIAIAAMVPWAKEGTVEVRPLAGARPAGAPHAPSVRPAAAHATLERVVREESSRILAILARRTGSLDLAEDALQDALAAAATAWPRTGVPQDPVPWIFVVARRRAIDRMRLTARDVRDGEAVARLEAEAQEPLPIDGRLPDERLELLLGCCHPDLDLTAQVALTLRSVGGLTTAEIAAAFLVSEATMSQRLVRAKARLRRTGAAFRAASADELPERLTAVLGVLYLIFNEGYAASGGTSRVRVTLCDEAIRLARLLAVLLPDDPEVAGLAALMLFHDARRSTRVDADGVPVALDEQDRSGWDRARIAEADRLLERGLAAGRRGPYLVQACVASLHAQAPTAAVTDWPQIAALYETLAAERPGPAVELARIAAIGMADGVDAALALLDAAENPLDARRLALRAELLRRGGRHDEARAAFEQALRDGLDGHEAGFARARLSGLPARPGRSVSRPARVSPSPARAARSRSARAGSSPPEPPRSRHGLAEPRPGRAAKSA